MTQTAHRNALQSGHELHWYRIERVLGQGAFGITYLAQDVNLHRQVAIKEYMPAQLSIRETSQFVQPLSEDHREDFQAGLQRFISEARTLTLFEHPNLIRVFNVFENNNTAYMVMNYEVGQSLQQLIKRKPPLSEEQLHNIIPSLLGGLQCIHEKGFVHRDIKPGNIFIRSNGSPVLLDFGSARQTVQDKPQTLTNFVSPGYAPIEQYISKSDKQGPWTDIYGLAATLYRVIAGSAPQNAIDRSESILGEKIDPLMPLTVLAEGKYSERLLTAIDHGLAFWAHDRPQTVVSWREKFGYPADITITYTMTQAVTDRNDPATENTGRTTDTAPSVRTAVLATTGSAELPTTLESEMSTTTHNEPGMFPAATAATTTELSARNRSMQMWITSGAVAVLMLVIYFLLFYRPVHVQPQPTVQSEETPAQTLANVTEVKPETAVSSSNNDAQQSRIPDLLNAAETAARDLKLTTPVGDNAYEYYQQILNIDPANELARQGIMKLSDTYLMLANRAMDAGDINRASRYISKAEELWPESSGIAPARQRLNITTAQPLPADSAGKKDVFGDIKKWFRESAEKAKENETSKQQGDTMDDRIRRSMGGAQ